MTATTAGFGVNLSAGVFSISQTQPPYGFDSPVNMGLTASVGSSNLTINVVGANGSAPSATNPVMIPFRSTTLATGTPVWGVITSALSIVVPSGATLGSSSSNVPFRIWVFAEYNAGTPELGVAICSVSPTVYPCTSWESTRVTTTSITGLATSPGVLYSTTGVASDAVRIIGFAEYTTGLTTAGLYASTPTTLQLMGPGVGKPGSIVQSVRTDTGTVATGATVVPFDNTIPQNTEGNQYMTQSITPIASPNLLSVTTQGMYSSSAANTAFAQSLFRDSVANALSTAMAFQGSGAPVNILTQYRAQAASTSSTSFKARTGTRDAGTTTFNGTAGAQLYGGVSNSYIQIDEIMG